MDAIVGRSRLSRLGLHSLTGPIFSGAIGLLLAKAVSLLTLIVTIPLTLHQFGAERFGIWMTLSTIASMLGVADLGVGSGVMTDIAKANGRGDDRAVQHVVSNSFVTLLALWALFSAVVLIIYPLVDWASTFNVRDPRAGAETGPAVLAVLLCSTAAIPASLGLRILMGLQRGFTTGIWMSAQSISALMVLLIGVHYEVSLPKLLLLFTGLPALVGIMSTVVIFFGRDKRLRPTMSDLHGGEMLRLMVHGMRYFVITLVYVVTFTLDNVLIARFLNPEAVAQYSIADRLYQVIAVALAMINAPLWPAYAEAHARGDRRWIARTFLLSMAATFGLGALAMATLLLAGQHIYGLWVGPGMVPSFMLGACVGLRRLMEALYNASNNLMNALDKPKLQLSFGIAMAVAALCLRIIFIRWFGLTGAPLAVIASVLAFGFVPVLLVWNAGFGGEAAGHDTDAGSRGY